MRRIDYCIKDSIQNTHGPGRVALKRAVHHIIQARRVYERAKSCFRLTSGHQSEVLSPFTNTGCGSPWL